MAEINYNGKILPLHFGLHAINEFTKHSRIDFKQAITSTEVMANLDSFVPMATQGLNDGARRNGNSERYSEDDVWDMFDEKPDLLSSIMQAFFEAITVMSDRLKLPKNALPTSKPRTKK